MDVFPLTRHGNIPLEAREIVRTHLNHQFEKTDPTKRLAVEQVNVVWFCKTLQNWKALVTTDQPDGLYFEVTHNGDKRETYLDTYGKIDNVCIKDDL